MLVSFRGQAVDIVNITTLVYNTTEGIWRGPLTLVSKRVDKVTDGIYRYRLLTEGAIWSGNSYVVALEVEHTRTIDGVVYEYYGREAFSVAP